MIENFKPMLAARHVTELDIRFPCVLSAKLDGIRAVIPGDRVLSRRLKKIPNLFCQEMFAHLKARGFDGELIVGRPNDEDVYNTTQSGVMTKKGNPDVTMYCFDMYTLGDLTFKRRFEELQDRISRLGMPQFKVHPHRTVKTLDEFLEAEEDFLEEGYEGICGRHPNGPYKFGRSTEREQFLFKLKRFVDSEMKIEGFEELCRNDNIQTRNEIGAAKRSSHKANMTPMDTMGALIGTDIHNGWPVRLGSGFSAALRKEIWENRKKWKGQIVKYKYFPKGMKDGPRHPIYLGKRSKIDL